MTLLTIVKLAAIASIVLLLFALAVRAKRADVSYLVREWRLGLGAFLSMFVCVPAAAFLMARLLELDRVVEVAVIAMALSPLPPILPRKQIKAGGGANYVTGLLLGAALVSLLVAPLGVTIASSLFDVDVSISPAALVKPLAISVFLPLALGLIAARFLGPSVDRVSEIARMVGSVLLIAVVLAFLVILGPAMWTLVGDGTLLVLVAMAVVGLAAGSWLGRPEPGNRAALALASSTRHPGVALAIAVHAMPEVPRVPAAIVLSLLVSAALSVPFLRLAGREDRAGVW